MHSLLCILDARTEEDSLGRGWFVLLLVKLFLAANLSSFSIFHSDIISLYFCYHDLGFCNCYLYIPPSSCTLSWNQGTFVDLSLLYLCSLLSQTAVAIIIHAFLQRGTFPVENHTVLMYPYFCQNLTFLSFPPFIHLSAFTHRLPRRGRSNLPITLFDIISHALHTKVYDHSSPSRSSYTMARFGASRCDPVVA